MHHIFEVSVVTTPNRFRLFLFAIATATVSLSMQPATFAATLAETHQASMDRDSGKCKKYVREHHGHPDSSKGVDIVKIVYVDCPRKR